MFTLVCCPNCGKSCTVHYKTETVYKPMLVCCEPEDDGCAGYFVVELDLKVTATVFSLNKTEREV